MTDNLKALGASTATNKYPTEYDPSILEAFENNHPDTRHMVTFECTEFTSLCEITQQPDFGKIIIRYIPDGLLVESKSMKLYLFSFRNHCAFHERAVNTICEELFKLLNPHYIEVEGFFLPRGGIAIHPFAQLYYDKWEQFAFERMLRKGV